MILNIDSAIFIGFLIVNLAVGMFFGKGIKSIKQYAIGDRNFSTATITATIVATWMAGSSIAVTAGEAYKQGLYYIIPGLAGGISFFIVAYFYAPRMAEFLGHLSVAEAMGNLFGRNTRIITALSAIVIGIGNIAVQFSVCTLLLNQFLGISEAYALILSSFIVITYSTFGGIKAVTFTDMIQFATFCIVLPMALFLIWQTLDSSTVIFQTLSQNPIFSYSEFFSYKNPTLLNTALLFLFFIIPGIDPALFQRISMAKDTTQVTRSFTIAGFMMILIEYGIIASMGILVLAGKGPDLDADNLMNYMLDNYMHGAFKGLFVIGILAMLMSTADSYINCSAVLFAHDFCASIGLKFTEKKTLLLARLSALSIGIFGVLLSLFAQNLLDLILATYSFYMPIVSTPLILAIFGFRSQSKAVLTGMGAGFITVLLLKIYYPEVNNIILGMLANMLFLFGSHYLLNLEGGWVGIKDNSPLETIRQAQKERIRKVLEVITSFSLVDFCKGNSPKDKNIYVYFGLLSVISIFSAAFSIPKDIYNTYASLITQLLYSVLAISAVFITYPIWLNKFKNELFISFLWNVAMVYCLAFANSWLFMISDFNPTLLTILTVNLITLAILLRWQIAILIMVIGTVCSVKVYKYMNNYYHLSDDVFYQFKIIYSLAVVSAILIAFLKPKQEYIEEAKYQVKVLTDENVKLNSKVTGLEAQVANLNEQVTEYTARIANPPAEINGLEQATQWILYKINHELCLPISNVGNFSDLLSETIKKIDTDKLLTDLAKEIYDTSLRTSNMILRMLDLATYEVQNLCLRKTLVNFSELVEGRINQCQKIYLPGKHIRFRLEIEPEMLLNIDPNYMRQAIDNLVISSINSSKEGVIIISAKKKEDKVIFTINDQGVGIPKPELDHIFTPLKPESMEPKAHGRRTGLALCRSVVEAHGGSIKVNSNGVHGVILRFSLPLPS